MFPIAVYLPNGRLSNEDLHREFPDWNPEKVAQKIGIRNRHIAAKGETALDMAFHAAEELFAHHPEQREKTDYLLFCTQSPDYFLPTTACLLQDRLQLRKSIGALDFNLGCSGFVYGLSLAKGLLCGGLATGVLLVTSETYSKYIHPQDRGNRSIFGDAATVTFLQKDDIARIGNFVFGTDGRGAENLIVQTGGARSPAGLEKNPQNDHFPSSSYLYMNGPEIFNFTIEVVPKMVKHVLEKNHLTLPEISCVIFHQANSFILNYLRTILDIPREKFYINLEQTGNTVSSTLPIALKDAEQRGIIQRGDKILLAGFGVGYSYGATVLTF